MNIITEMNILNIDIWKLIIGCVIKNLDQLVVEYFNGWLILNEFLKDLTDYLALFTVEKKFGKQPKYIIKENEIINLFNK
jgi:hypothetical protein